MFADSGRDDGARAVSDDDDVSASPVEARASYRVIDVKAGQILQRADTYAILSL